MKKKRILIILVIVLVVIFAFAAQRKNEVDEANLNKNNELLLGQNAEGIVDTLTEAEKNDWIGEYELGESIIQICRINQKTCDLMVYANGQISKDVLYFDSDNKLSYTGEFLNETYDITLKKDMEKIFVDANSSDMNSIYNQIDGVYVKKNRESFGWNGVYESGDIQLSLSEINDEKIYMYINKAENKIGKNISSCTSDKLVLNEKKTNEENNIKVQKNIDGIKVEANSTNKSSLLNEVSGEYKKLN